jgi:CRISPR-associated endonuclease Csn1
LILQVLKISSSGSVTFIKPNETNIGARYIAKLTAQKAQKNSAIYDPGALDDNFFQRAFSALSLQNSQARQIAISPIGELRDPGFVG